MGRRTGIRIPVVFRLFRLFRHGDRFVPPVRHQAAAQFPFTLQGGKHHRILAALAHDAVTLLARLPVYPAWWRPKGRGKTVRQSDADDVAWWLVAWGRMEFRDLGRTARRLFDGQS